MSKYRYIECPGCQQGRLFVCRDIDSGALILECEECSRAWNQPDEAAGGADAYLAIDVATEYATADEIKAAGWSKYEFHKVED